MVKKNQLVILALAIGILVGLLLAKYNVVRLPFSADICEGPCKDEMDKCRASGHDYETCIQHTSVWMPECDGCFGVL